MKKILILILLVASFTGIAAFALYSWYQSGLNTTAGTDDTNIIFEVESGDDITAISKKLKDQGLVGNETIFQIYFKLNSKLAEGIQAGFFDLNQNMTIPQIAEALQKSRSGEQVKITIPEGLRYDEIAAILETGFKDIPGSKFSRSEFMDIAAEPDKVRFSEKVQTFLNEHKPAAKNLEGYLFPETYFFEYETDAVAIIERLISTLINKLTESDLNAVSESGYTLYDILIVASMIERETFTEEEKPMVADIIYKRLEEGVEGVKLLQIDATLLYGVKDWKADPFPLIQIDGAYNTYKRTGLPPTPISNPGIGAIKAAIYPQANDYFFYLHDANGKVYYAKTNAEHEANKRKYL